mgnify:CR=1 FL=1
MTLPQPLAIAPDRIHPDTLPGYVHLKVKDLERQLNFYQQVVGLQLNWREGKSAGLGTGAGDILRLTQIENGRRYQRTTGIYHFAILMPNRKEMARTVARLFTLRWPNYPTDHVMTKSTYLDDPEGNNIEIYSESPEDGITEVVNDRLVVRRVDGRPSSGRDPMDMEALFAHLDKNDQLDPPMPAGTRMGHYHLYVASLTATQRFYHQILGFDDMGVARDFRMGMASAGGYHHHIGFNTWQGEGAPPPPADALGLLYFTFNLPDAQELERVDGMLEQKGVTFERRPDGLYLQDPSHNALLLTTAEIAQINKI